MSIAETQNLLNPGATHYNCLEKCFKTSPTNYVLPITSSIIPFIPLVLLSLGLKMCSWEADSLGLYMTNSFAGVSIAINGIFFARAVYQKCTFKAENFNTFASKKDQIDILKMHRFENNLWMGMCGTIIATHSIYLFVLNLYCKDQ